MTRSQAITPDRTSAPGKPRAPRRAAAPEALMPSPLSPREVEILNRLARPSAGLACRIGDLTLQLHPGGSASAVQIARTEGCDIAFAIDGRKGLLRLPWELVNGALAQVDADLPPTEIDSETRALLLELALAPLLDSFEAASGCRISLRHAGRKATLHKSLLAVALCFRGPIARDQTAIAFLAPKDAELLAAAFENAPAKPRSWNGLPLPLAVRLGQTRLKAGELASLQPRDVVLFDDTALTQRKVLVVVGEHLCFFGQLEGSRVTLSDPAGPPGTSVWEQGAMTSAENKSSDRAKAPDTEFEALPVTLQFEIGRKQVPLAELRRIASGYTFDLGRGIKDPIDIYANGSLVGRGEFVRIGESLGVRITRLFNHE